MILSITYDTPTPPATCGFKAQYRKNTAAVYTEILAEESATGMTATVAAPCCIEGYVQSDCCDGLLSVNTPFGINSYVEFETEAGNNTEIQQFTITVTSEYANPYDTLVAGTLSYTVTGDPYTLNYDVTLPAGETTITENIGVASISAIIVSNVVTSHSPIFSYGGELQQTDPLRTPDYFAFIASPSGSTWDGSPTSLPSFTQNAFIVTEQDESENVTAGNLLISWIYDSIYEDGVTPYDNVTFEVYDSNSDLIGTNMVSTSTKGLRNTTIALTKDTIPLTETNEFTMTTRWDDNSEIVSKVFYLPPATI
jgi:hypothetical protein